MNLFNSFNIWFSGDVMGFKNLLLILFIGIYLTLGATVSWSTGTVVYPEIHSLQADTSESVPAQNPITPGSYIVTRVNQAGEKVTFFHNIGTPEPDLNLIQADNSTQIDQNVAAAPLSISGDTLVVTPGANYQQAVVGNPLSQDLEVTLLDANLNPIIGEQVTFQVSKGGGSFPGDLTETTLTTDGAGKASISFTAGEQTSANPYGWVEPGQNIQQVGLNVIDAFRTSDESVRTRIYAYGFPDQLADVKIHYELSDLRGYADTPLTLRGAIFVSVQDQFGNFISNMDIVVSPASMTPKNTSSCAKANNDNRPPLILPADFGVINNNVGVPPFAYEQYTGYSGDLTITSNYMPSTAYLFTGGIPDAIYNFNISAGSINDTTYVQTKEFGNCDGVTPPEDEYWLWNSEEFMPEVGTTAYIYTWLSRIKENEENDEGLTGCTPQCSEYIVGTRDYTNYFDASSSNVVFRINGVVLENTPTPYGDIAVASYTVPAQSYTLLSASVDYTKESIAITTVDNCDCTERQNSPSLISYYISTYPLSITTEETKTLPVDADGLLLCDVEFNYDVNVYVAPLSVKLTIYEDGNEFEVVTLTPGSTEPAVLYQGLQFDPSKTYTAVITAQDLDDGVLNGISSNPITLLFDVEPFKGLYIKNEEDVPLSPGDSLKIHADAIPEFLPEITWSIAETDPDDDAYEVEAEIDSNTGDLRVGVNSGSGWVTVRGSYNQCIFHEARIRIGCFTCQGNASCDSGTGFINLSSIDVTFSLGKTSGGFDAGDLYIRQDTISPWLYTPGSLKYSSLAPGNEVIYLNDGTLRQILTDKIFVNIEAVDVYSYQIDFYTSDAADTKINGIYTIVPSSVPYSSWLIENPDRSLSINERLKVTETRDSSTIVNEYYHPDPSTWSLNRANGQKTIFKTIAPGGVDQTVETIITKDSLNVVSEHIENTYQEFPYGKKLITTANDPTGDNITSSLQYYDDQAVASYGKIKSRENSDGSWHYYEYDNVTGYLTNEYSNYLNLTIDQRQTATITSYSYDASTFTTEDSDATEDRSRPREIIVSKDDKIISRVFNVYIRDVDGSLIVKNEHAISQTSSYGDPNNLLTIKEYYSDQATGPENGKLKSQLSEDGKLTSYTYNKGTYSPSGNQPGTFTADPLGTFTKVEVINGTEAAPAGIDSKSKISVSVANDYGTPVLEEQYIKTASGQDRIGWITYILNSDGIKVDETHHSEGTFTEDNWGCCTLTSQTDILGITTQYQYDDLKRRYWESKPSLHGDITTTYTFDSSDRQLSKEVSSGGLTLTNSKDYYTSGKLKSSTDTRNLTTNYSYDIPNRITTQVNPGNFTEIREYYKDGRIKSITGTGVIHLYYMYGINTDGTTYTTVHTGSETSPVWEKTTTDFVGRTIKVEKPGYLSVEAVNHYYNQKGQLWKTESEGMADILYEYDELGDISRSGLDVDGNGLLTSNSMDRITLNDTSVVQDGSDMWEVTTKKVLPRDNDPYEKTVSTNKTRLTGLGAGGLVSETVSLDIYGNTTNHKTYLDRSTHETTAVTDFPDSTVDAANVSRFGLLVSSTDKANLTTLFDYDTLGRKVSETDPRTGSSIIHYNTINQVEYTEDAASYRTTYGYDPATGRKSSETIDGKTKYYQYDSYGNITHTWGSTYPIHYVFDPLYGRRTEMHTYTKKDGWDQNTWPADPGTAAITQWHYHEASGLLEYKEDALGNNTGYTYYSGGKLHTRTWARIVDSNPVVTTYTYDTNTGQLTNIDYSDSTPDISFDEYTRLGFIKQVTDGQGTRLFSYNDNLQNYEEAISGSLNKTITRTFETTGVVGRNGGVSFDTDYSITYGYDDASGRLDTVSWQVGNSADSATYTFVENSHLIDYLTYGSGTNINYGYEPFRDLKDQVKNQYNTTLLSQYDYIYDPLQRVDSMSTTDNIFASFLPNSPANTIDFSKSSDVGYTPNSINQYTEITRNSVPKTLTYDDDGNLLNDETLIYTWDAENRLIGVVPLSPSEGDKHLEFVYDYKGRRVEKKVFTFNLDSYSLLSTTKYLYDDWNLIAELDENGTIKDAYVWGLDLSRSLQGAGGVGGVLAGVDMTTDTTLLYMYDGNGNVERLLDSTDGSQAAVYKYDPYGNLISQAGLFAEGNPFRFSTKYLDGESGLYYYGYRYYSPEHGRWMSRDPLGEDGGVNLYGFVGNDGINYFDPYGMSTWDDVKSFSRKTGWYLYGSATDTANLVNQGIIFPLVDLLSVPDQILYCLFGISEEDLLAFSAQFPGGYDDVMVGAVISGKNAGKAIRTLSGYIPESSGKLVSTDMIRFTQDTAGKNIQGVSSFKDGRPIKELIDKFEEAGRWPDDVPPIRVFEKDKMIYTLDNRRLLAAQKAGIEVKIIPATSKELADESFKFTNPGEGWYIGVKGELK